MSRLFPHGGNKIDTRLEKKIWAFILHDRDGRGINTGGEEERANIRGIFMTRKAESAFGKEELCFYNFIRVLFCEEKN